jgi:peptide/nickel transport system ATP-binding protein
MIQPLLKVTDLSIVTNQNLVLVDNINFYIDTAEVVGLVGESGSGKTLTALSILQLLNSSQLVTKGNIDWHSDNDTTNLLSCSTKQIEKIRGAQIGFIFQEPMTSLNPVMTCGEQVAEMLRLHLNMSTSQAYVATLQWFEKVKLTQPKIIYNKYPHQLSGGQKQRIMIAIALCCQPKLVIADEPTTSLDATVQASIIQLLMNLQLEYKMALLFISHNMPLVSNIANRIMVMYNGKIIEQQTTSSIINKPIQQYTKALFACMPKPQNKGQRLLTVQDFIANPSIATEAIGNKPVTLNTPTEATAPLLEICNVSAQYDGDTKWWQWKTKKVTAIEHINLKLMQEQTLGILGESGSGKSTLAKCIVKMLTPASGHIAWQQQNIANFNNQQLLEYRKQIQIIFQDPYASLNPRMQIGKAVEESLHTFQIENKSNRKAMTIDLLAKVGLNADIYNRMPHELSGGQRQRIVIARALAVQPKLLICDESVSSLDVSVQAQILNLLNQLKASNQLSYIFISHDMNVVNYMSDYVAVMQNGNVVEQGTTTNIYNNPANLYTQSLLDAIPKLKF